MHKYIGTEQQLLDLGFEKITNKYCQTTETMSEFSEIQVWVDDGCVLVSHYDSDSVDFMILKLFVEMVERGLIVWEE